MSSSKKRQAYLPQEGEYQPTKNKDGVFSGLKRNFLKFEPNGKCPCGSDKKYKKCCKGVKNYYLKEK